MNKLDLLDEYIELTNNYKKEGIKTSTRESFLAGAIITIEDLLYRYFDENRQFFADSLEDIGIDLSKPFTLKDQNIKGG